MFTQGTIEFKVSLYKFLIALLLGGNTGLLGILIRFIWKWYRKYKNAIMLYIEEHERLVEDYITRHPEEEGSYPIYFNRLPKSDRRNPSFKRPLGIRKSTSREDDSTE